MTVAEQKVKALMQYICSRVPREKSGVVKLNKIMWFCETETMYKTGEALTGHTYIRMRFGPVALDAPTMRNDLIKEGKLEEMPPERMSGGMERRIFVATRPPENMDTLFTPEQLDIINEQIERYTYASGPEVSDMSHDSIWASLEDADTMPLHLYKWKPVYTPEQSESLKEAMRKQAETETNCGPF